MVFELSEEAERTLIALAEMRGISPVEAVRLAISTELFLLRRRAGGARVLLKNPDGSYEELLPVTA